MICGKKSLMNPRRIPVLLLAAAVAVAPVGQAADAPAQSGSRPRIGLVLAGGGAKGGAHVGVIKVLEEMRVPIDCIAGTSMGALVGGGYAAGLPAAELETFVTGIDWKQVVGGEGSRQRQPIEQKRLEGVAASGLEVGLRGGKLVAPSGLVDTSAIDDLLRVYVATGRNAENFDALPIPFRAVATDMVRGEMVVLDRGDLATAMRASMAIPGAFAPVVGGGRVLADGGMVRNIPVDIARQTCADVVIVVNLVEPETPPEKLVQATQLISRSMDVMLQLNEIAQLADADRPGRPHRRADGRHRDLELRAYAGDDSARRNGRPRGGRPAGRVLRCRWRSTRPGDSG